MGGVNIKLNTAEEGPSIHLGVDWSNISRHTDFCIKVAAGYGGTSRKGSIREPNFATMPSISAEEIALFFL